jgi:hypothetical protein
MCTGIKIECLIRTRIGIKIECLVRTRIGILTIPVRNTGKGGLSGFLLDFHKLRGLMPV